MSYDQLESIRIIDSYGGGRIKILSPISLTDGSGTPGTYKDAYNKYFKTAEVAGLACKREKFEFLDDLKSSIDTSAEYVKYVPKTPEELNKMVEYEMDDEDDLFLNSENKRRKRERIKPLTPDIFEAVIDRMEKETKFEGHPVVVEGIDDVCCICNSGEHDNLDQIIYCDMCNIAVHQECYGVPYIPEGQWLCKKCKLSPSRDVICELCPFRGGAFKPTSDHKWVHVICAIWIPEVSFQNPTFMEPVEGVFDALRRRSKLQCSVCRGGGESQARGACLQCSRHCCTRSFHVTCAQMANLEMSDISTKGDPEKKAYCYLHGSTAQNYSKNFIRDQFLRSKKRVIQFLRANGRLGGSHSHTTPLTRPRISQESLKKIGEHFGMNVNELFYYWEYKRLKRSGVPLIRRLQAATASRKDGMQLSDLGQAVSSGRAALERSRLLCELIKKREADKLHFALLSRDLFQAAFRPLDHVFKEFITRSFALDDCCVFHNDVIAEDYESFIEKRMCLNTIKRKNSEGLYTSLDLMRADFDLMLANCEKFNNFSEDEYHLEYGRRYGKKMEQELGDLEDYLNSMAGPRVMTEVLRVGYYDGKGGVQPARKHRISTDIPPGDSGPSSRKRSRPGPIKDRRNSLKREGSVTGEGVSKISKETDTSEVCPATPKLVTQEASTSSGRRGSTSNGRKEQNGVPPLSPSHRPSSLRRPVTRGSEDPWDSDPGMKKSSRCAQPVNGFNGYRDNGGLSPEGASSDSSTESEREARPPPCENTHLSPGDIVKVRWPRKERLCAGLVVDCSVSVVISDGKRPNGVIHPSSSSTVFVELLDGSSKTVALERSQLQRIDLEEDNSEVKGIEEAGRRRRQLLKLNGHGLPPPIAITH